MALYNVFRGIQYFLQIISYVLLAYCILSWLLPPYHKIMRFLGRLVDPLLTPVRRVFFRLFPHAALDLSPLVIFLLLNLLSQLIWQLYRWLTF